MAWRGSISRSLVNAAWYSATRSQPAAASRIRAPPSAVPRLQRRQHSFASPRNLGELGCMQSFLPLYSRVAAPRLTSNLSVNVRACCELSQVDGKKMPLRFDREKWKRWLMEDTGVIQWESM